MPRSPGNVPGMAWRLAWTVMSGLATRRGRLVQRVGQHHAARDKAGPFVDAPRVVVSGSQEGEVRAALEGLARECARHRSRDAAPAKRLEHADARQLAEPVARRDEDAAAHGRAVRARE